MNAKAILIKKKAVIKMQGRRMKSELSHVLGDLSLLMVQCSVAI
jgi:hypothetical protein